MNRLCLGVDTSCYTTSLAAVNEAGEVVFDGRQPLAVAAGERGLRQSDALFQHLRQLGPMMAESRAVFGEAEIISVAASAKPRPAEDSYLPVFLAGLTAGAALAAGAGVALSGVSHQEGHLRCVWIGDPELPAEFLALHLSGGTTELLRARQGQTGYDLELLGGSSDLHAGQFVDRVGVAMGLPFPAGPALEALARQGDPAPIRLPVSVQGLTASFSGPLSAAERLLGKGAGQADLAAAVFACLSETVRRLLVEALERFNLPDVALGGGVTASTLLRAALEVSLPEARLHFTAPELATDNAVGVALLGLDFWRRNKGVL